MRIGKFVGCCLMSVASLVRAETPDMTVATPSVLKLKVTVLDYDTEQPLPYVKMGFNFNNGTDRIVRALDVRVGSDGVGYREVPYDGSGNIVLDGSAYAGAKSYANAVLNLLNMKGRTIDIDPVDSSGRAWNLSAISGTYRVRRVVAAETANMTTLPQGSTHDNATIANSFTVQTGANLHFKCWLKKPASVGAHTVTYDTSLVQTPGDYLAEQVNDGGKAQRVLTAPVNAIWPDRVFTGWTFDGVPFDPSAAVLVNLQLVPNWEEPADAPAPFTLDVSRPQVDVALTATPAEGVGTGGTFVYRWWRGNTSKVYEANPVSTSDSYTPVATDYEHWFKFELAVAVNGINYPLGSKEFFFSKLPVLYMTTNDGGNPTAAKEDHDGRLFAQGNAEWKSLYNGDFSIHVRGNSSAQYPKLPYKIKLKDKTKMFGIAKNKHWVLISNYLDPSLLRDKIAYDFAATLGNLAMESTWVDCVLNGEWIGCYLFCEHLRVDDKRVPVYDWEKAAENAAAALMAYYPDLSAALDGKVGPLEDQMVEDFSWITSGKVTYAGEDWTLDTTVYPKYSQNLTGGYLFEMSEEYDLPAKWTVEKSGNLIIPTMINAPETMNTNPEVMQYCQDYWNQYWDACRSPDGYANGKHWKELCKLNSMVTYWLTMEIFGNDDCRQKSRFAYKDVDDKLYFGPVWDFDWGMGGAPMRARAGNTLAAVEPTGWKVSVGSTSRVFFREWIDDPLFCTRAYEKYHEYRTEMMKIVAANGTWRQHVDYLLEAGDANSAKWPYKGQSFRQDTEDLRVYLVNRFAWLDQQFASVGTLMASLRMAAAAWPAAPSASPYVQDGAALPVSFQDVLPSMKSRETSVLRVSHEKTEDLSVAFSVGSAATSVASVQTYVNGLSIGEPVAVTAGQALNVTIPAEKMDAKEDQMDCVQFVARNSSGAVVARNFALVDPVGEAPTDPIALYCRDCAGGVLKVAMKVMDKTTQLPLANVSMKLNMDGVPVAVGTTDENGYLYIEQVYNGKGEIVQNGQANTAINLKTVARIDCDPLTANYSWLPLTAGLVRNIPDGYCQYVTVLDAGTHQNAVINQSDLNGDGEPDFLESGASIYFECYLTDNNTAETQHTVTFDTTGMSSASAAGFASANVQHGGSYLLPTTAPENANGREFKGWRMTVSTSSQAEAALPGVTTDLAADAETLTVNQNFTLTPVWGSNPNAKGLIHYRVHYWDHSNYWSKWTQAGDLADTVRYNGQTTIPINGLTFVIKSYDSNLLGLVPDSRKIPVGRPNTVEGWAQSRVEAKYKGLDEDGKEIWEATYEISSAQLQYLNANWIIDTDPDEHDIGTYDRGLGWGEESVTFDWDWYVKEDDRAGAGLTGVREIPECIRRGGTVPNGSNKNDVALLTQDMIDNGFEFTFNCYVVPALVVDFDCDKGTPGSYPEQRTMPVDSLPLWEQRFTVTNPGSPTRGDDERFEGWYEVLSDGSLAAAPWNFGKSVEHSMTLKAVYRDRKQKVDVGTPKVIEVTGPGTLSWNRVLADVPADSTATVTIVVDGGEPVVLDVSGSTATIPESVVFGGDVATPHSVSVLLTLVTEATEINTSISLDDVMWVPYSTDILDAVVDRGSARFTVENVGTDPTKETSGVTIYSGAAQVTTSTLAEGVQTGSVVNPAGGATTETTGTQDYWYVNYDDTQNQLLGEGGGQVFAETPPTLSPRESTSFHVGGLTGASVVRWEMFVTDGATGDSKPSDLTVTVTLTPTNGPVRTETYTYRAADFTNGEFMPGFLGYTNELASTRIALDFTYTNNDQGDGRAFVDNIYWKCVQEDGGHTWMKENPGEGVALMIVDHEDAGDGYVYLAFTPQLREGVDAMFWFTNSVKRGYFDVKTGTSRTAAESATPAQITVSKAHESTPEKVWVKVPQSAVESGEFSKLFVAGKPVNYKNKDGTIAQTSATGSGAESVNTFGMLKVLTTTTNTMVSVPWTWYSDQESGAGNIPADKLVKTTNLTVGDLLYAYSGSGQYLGWTVAEVNGVLQWQPIATVAKVGGNATVIVHDESGDNRTTLPRGAGVWVVRQHPVDDSGNAVPFWLYGQSVTTAATTVIAPKGKDEDTHSTMLGNPHATAVKINSLTFTGTIGDTDTIIVPNGTDSPMYLQYRDTGTKRKPSGVKKWVWVHLDTSTTPAKNVYDWEVEIPAGLAFWYVRRDNRPLSVTWGVPVE